jgi:hypothetical protein
MKKIIICFLFIICTIFFTGCIKEYEEGYFRYQVFQNRNTDKQISISGLTELGNQQKVLVVPRFIQGMIVQELVDRSKYYRYGRWESNALEKVFLTDNIPAYAHTFDNCSNLRKIIYINIEPGSGFYKYQMVRDNEEQLLSFVYVTKTVYDPGRGLYWEDFVKCANVNYYFNYENSENHGIYWIDDVDYGCKIEFIPEDPFREGYSFGGWYKEEECINEWDFNNDITPSEHTDENDNVILQETNLYAKWILN